MFSSYMQTKKELLITALRDFFKNQKQNTQNQWGQDALTQLELFMQNGKMIRGTLVFLGFESQTETPSQDLVKLALAMELFHAGLLVHDDIMDDADTRRGKPSMHAYFTSLMTKNQYRYPKNTGKFLAICTGNVAFFLGTQLLLELHDTKIAAFCAKELQTVNYAQMQDLTFGSQNKPVQAIDDILSLYKGKTGRYSVLLPLTVGAMLGKASPKTLSHIEKFSENIGVAYQLVDDTLDLFGDEKQTGKPIGGDVKEGKQTPYIFFLRKKNNKEINTRIETIFSKGDITKEDIRFVQEAIKKNNIDQEISDLMVRYERAANEAITRIPLKKRYLDLYQSFVEYLTHRIQ